MFPGLRALVPCVATLLLGGCFAVGKPSGSSGRRSNLGDTDGGTSTAGEETPACVQACPTLECGGGTHPAPLSGECCPTTCEPDDCSLVDCPPLDCGSNTHAVQPKTSCCAVCQPNPAALPGDTCEEGQAGYADFREKRTAALGAKGCEADSDCRVVIIDNACDHGCGTALLARIATALKADLDDYAANHCAACTSGTATTCPPLDRVAFCTGGLCSAH